MPVIVSIFTDSIVRFENHRVWHTQFGETGSAVGRVLLAIVTFLPSWRG